MQPKAKTRYKEREGSLDLAGRCNACWQWVTPER